MKIRVVSILVFCLALATAAYAQDQNSAPPEGQNSGMGAGGGMRGGRGGMGMMGRAVSGTVTEVAPDHYTIKTFSGEIYTVHYSGNTRMMKQPAGRAGAGQGEGGGQGFRRSGGGPPQEIKASDIKVGDAIAAMGDVDASAKSVGAMAVILLDPERAKEMAQMEANFGKTWLMGRVTAIDGVKVTVTGGPGDAAHTFVADENTNFLKRRQPIALTDIQVGDMVRVDGALKNGVFTAASVNDMGAPSQGRMQRNGPPPQQ